MAHAETHPILTRCSQPRCCKLLRKLPWLGATVCNRWKNRFFGVRNVVKKCQKDSTQNIALHCTPWDIFRSTNNGLGIRLCPWQAWARHAADGLFQVKNFRISVLGRNHGRWTLINYGILWLWTQRRGTIDFTHVSHFSIYSIFSTQFQPIPISSGCLLRPQAVSVRGYDRIPVVDVRWK